MLFDCAPAPSPLVGIAKLAAGSELLSAKSQVRYFEIPARSLLNRTRPGMPFEWTINPYRGCEFGCKYCYARYTHEFMGLDDGRSFENRIYAKAEVTALLRRDLRQAARTEGIAIGTATDPYQPAERQYGRTRAILEVFLQEKGRRVSLTTKSDLILRDIPLLREVARRNVVSVNMTITTLHTRLARLLEPRAPRPDLRLAAVRALADAGLCVGVFPNPVMPYLTDSENSLDRLARAAKAAGASYFGGGPLFLMPAAQKVFFPFVEERFPKLAERYRELYRNNAYLGADYKAQLSERIRRIREHRGLQSAPLEYRPELWAGEEQGSLFSLQ